MDERKACALLKQQFEAAGYAIAENVPFDEDGVAFDLDGFDYDARVGYEYVTAEAGDGWDVDTGVIAELAVRREQGLHILVVDEAEAPDEASLTRRAVAFLAEVEAAQKKAKSAKKPAAKEKAAEKPAAKKPAAKKPPPVPKKPAAKKPAKKPAK